jgi:hypothetical protein
MTGHYAGAGMILILFAANKVPNPERMKKATHA